MSCEGRARIRRTSGSLLVRTSAPEALSATVPNFYCSSVPNDRKALLSSSTCITAPHFSPLNCCSTLRDLLGDLSLSVRASSDRSRMCRRFPVACASPVDLAIVRAAVT